MLKTHSQITKKKLSEKLSRLSRPRDSPILSQYRTCCLCKFHSVGYLVRTVLQYRFLFLKIFYVFFSNKLMVSRYSNMNFKAFHLLLSITCLYMIFICKYSLFLLSFLSCLTTYFIAKKQQFQHSFFEMFAVALLTELTVLSVHTGKTKI